MMAMKFHRRCGDRVTLLNDNSTAVRNFVEFNHGLILSAEPLIDDIMFEVCIDRKVKVWNGSLEIGVTTLDPECMELPATATKLRNSAWILSGSSIVKDGVTLVNSYSPELDSLREGHCVGVMRTSKADLLFYVNGRCLGVAAKGMPSRLFAVIDLYGQCVQVSIMQGNELRPIMESSLDLLDEDPNNDDTLTSSEMDGTGLPPEASSPKETQDVFIPMTSEGACALVPQDRLRFHPRCGILVKLSANNKSAERERPLDEYNNGVVMTHRPLYDNELFEIRIDRLVDKWSGSIEVGVTTHNPAAIRFPSTMTNMDSGTIMMSGCKVLLNGHGTCMEYGNFNLDELREGDTVGMMRKSTAKLHYFINGIDQGVATDKVESQVWGVVDLYGMTVKVSIVDPCEDFDSNIDNIPELLDSPDLPAPSTSRPRIDEDSLLFHTLRDSNVIIINDGKTAHRPNAFEFFNNGIVMTNRTLRTGELFQVRLDLVIPKWAGSIEIGVTQHASNDIQLPFKMSNAKSGTWVMTGEDVIRDGIIIIPQYVRNLNKLVEGESVGVMRKDMGILHFFVNGVDQGPAAFNIPEHVFGIIDLYGRVAQATIIDAFTPLAMYSPESPLSTESNATIYPDMCFHRVHGRNARLSRTRLTASRGTVYSEFNDAVLFSSRPLRECDMFELRIDKMVDCWIGSLEIGVTAIRPEDLEANGGVGAIAGTATDLNWDTYILSGAAMMKDGECVRSGYPLDLDALVVGSRVGMMWHADRSLHYYLDGMDMGKAWYVPHLNIYAVVDLYGQCTQVTILQNEERAFNFNGCSNSDNSLLSNSRPLSTLPPPYWSFSEYCGDNLCLMHDFSIARRLTPDPAAALVFSSAHLAVNEIFEIKVMECKSGCAGSFRMGVTDVNILNAHVNRSLPPAVSCLPHYTAYIDGNYMKCSTPGSRAQEVQSFVPSLEWLRPGDRVGLKRTSDSRVLVYYNSEQLETAFEKVPDKVYVIMELFGKVTKIQSVVRGNPASAATCQITIPNDECYKQFMMSNTANNTCNIAVTTANQIQASNAYHNYNFNADPTEQHFGDSTFMDPTFMDPNIIDSTIMDPSILIPSYLYPDSSDSYTNPDPSNAEDPADADVYRELSNMNKNSTDVVGAAISYPNNTNRDPNDMQIIVTPYPTNEKPHRTNLVVDEILDPNNTNQDLHNMEANVTSERSDMNKDPTDFEANVLSDIVYLYQDPTHMAVDVVSDSAETNQDSTEIETNVDLIANNIYKDRADIEANVNADFSNVDQDRSCIEANEASDHAKETLDRIVTVSTSNMGPVDMETEGTQVTAAPPTAINDSLTDNDSLAKTNETSNTAPTENDTVATLSPRRRRHPLPYTFHYVHGKNIKLCSSDTVVIRTAGYRDGIAIISQPLRRGHSFRFRIDKVLESWSGSVSIGAVGALPHEEGVPSVAMHYDEAGVWVISSDILNENGNLTASDMAMSVDDIEEQSVLTIHFRFSGELALEVDGRLLGAISTVPRLYTHVFPLIELYGKIVQVSALLHPYTVASGTSLDLPIITENQREETIAELELVGGASARLSSGPLAQEPRAKRKPKSYSHDNLFEEEEFEAIVEAGPSTALPVPQASPLDKDTKNKNTKCRKICLNRVSLHQSLILTENTSLTVDNNEMVNRSIQKSQSTHSFCQMSDDVTLESEIKECLRHTFSVGSHVGEESNITEARERFHDTNIRHNDRYPEANDVDNLDNEIVDALTLETGNLPDLTEEQSSSIDESTRRDDFWAETLSVENLNYLNRILCLDQEGTEGHSLESEWEVSGEGCEHLHLVLKYWNFLVLPYPELRQAVSWGQVRCYCSDCQPDEQSPLAGWVRIERIDGVGACRRAFWLVARHTLGAAQGQAGAARRPRALAPALAASPPLTDIWFDEEGKPHHTVLAIEIDVEGSDAEKDRMLAFLIYLRSHGALPDDNPPSLEE